MDLKKIFIKDACPTKVGGQAVMEGIMMKGADRTAVVIRCPGGRMHIRIKPLKARGRWARIPLVRGVLVFVGALVEGTKTLMYSAEVLENYMEEDQEAEEDKVYEWLVKRFGEKGAMNAMLYSSVVIAILFTVLVFILAPTWLVDLCRFFTENAIALNLIEGVVRILMFVLYVWAISRMKEIQTVFQFHGAEHQCIHCFENGLELTPDNCKSFETLHPRCGTSFLMFVLVISLLLFSLLGWPNLFWRITSRLLLLPVIAGVSFELLQWAGRSDSWVVKILSMPGLLLQKLTTRRPDEKQLEVAIAAMKAVLDKEGPQDFEGSTDTEGNLKSLKEEKAEQEAAEAAGEPADAGEHGARPVQEAPSIPAVLAAAHTSTARRD
ncbi:MAG: DUF1385 domain-containing protein [Bacillota bacterium]|nr:DUF1385 domain-containing protein [Bacillota bacterium]